MRLIKFLCYTCFIAQQVAAVIRVDENTCGSFAVRNGYSNGAALFEHMRQLIAQIDLEILYRMENRNNPGRVFGNSAPWETYRLYAAYTTLFPDIQSTTAVQSVQSKVLYINTSRCQ
jgi:hypothetical protein